MSEDNAEYRYVRPLPCVRDEHGKIKGQTVKRLLAKIDEELNELKAELCINIRLERIAEEAADTITAITTLCEAVGIDATMREEAIRQVNHKNFSRGRL